MVGAAATGLLLALTARGDLPGLVACFALVPALIELRARSSVWRAGAITLIAQAGFLLAAYEGALPALPWTFPLLLILSAPAAVLPGVLLARLAPVMAPRCCAWSLPFSWTAAEFLASRRSIWGSFASPVSLGYTQFDGPLMGLAAYVGVTGVSFALLLTNVAVVNSDRHRWVVPLLALVAVSLAAHLPSRSAQHARSDSTSVAVVQPALDSDWYELARELPRAREVILGRLAALAEEARQAELVVFPEGALPPTGQRDSASSYFEWTDSYRADVLAGSIVTRASGIFNSVLAIRSGEAEVVFDKLAPVPVGEGGIRPGSRLTVGAWGGVWTAPLVCLDSLFPTFARRLVNSGAELLVVLADDSFARRMATARLHLATSAFRAVETGVPLVFASAHGPSALIDPRGRVIARSEFGRQFVLEGVLPPALPPTFYARHGDFIGMIAVFVTACLLLALIRFGAE